MKIEFDSDRASKLELKALSAFVNVISGDESTTTTVASEQVINNITETTSTDIAAQEEIASTQEVAGQTHDVSPDGEALDAGGFPWDERIHAGSKATNNNGTWKLKRGVDKAMVAQIQAEFTGGAQQTPAANQSGFQQQGNAATNANVNTNQQVGQSNVVQQNTAQDAAQHVNNTALTWPVVLQRTSQAKAAGTINDEQVTSVLTGLGITGGFPLLAPRTDLYQQFLTSLGI